MVGHGVLRVAGKVEHFHSRPGRKQGVRQLRAAHARHHNIGQEQRNVAGVCLAGFNRLGAGGRSQDPVADALQHPDGELANRFLVFDDENGLAAESSGWIRLSGRRIIRRVCDSWKIQLEGGALARFAVHPDVAPALLDHAVDGRQAQTSAFPSLLGGEERLEDVPARFGVHAMAGVAHRDHHELAGLHAGMSSGVGLIEADIGGLDGELAPGRHGVSGVHREIDHGLLDMARIGSDIPGVVRRIQHEVDILADHTPQHLLGVGDDGVHAEHA